jgi:hypothetical protein
MHDLQGIIIEIGLEKVESDRAPLHLLWASPGNKKQLRNPLATFQ